MKTMKTLQLFILALLVSCSSNDDKTSTPPVPQNPSIAGNVVTIAGSTQGNVLGTGTAAKFEELGGICSDSQGNLYVAESLQGRIKKITPQGVVSLFAGETGSGLADGPLATAKFGIISNMVTDASNTIYLTENDRIRKISNGNATLIAGTTSSGLINGPYITSKFNNVKGIAVDNTGAVYVCDAGNFKIRKIVVGDNVSTFCGSTQGTTDGNSTTAKFNELKGMVFDKVNNVFYVLDTSTIRKITLNGDVTTVCGTISPMSLDGNFATATFATTKHLCLDNSNNLYVTEYSISDVKIRKANLTTQQVTTIAGSSFGNVDGLGTNAKFTSAEGIIFLNNTLWVCDSYRVRKIN